MTFVGTRVGHVLLRSRLGVGGMGEVYEGFDEVLERRVAVKTIRPERRFSPEAKGRFLREARILSRLDHPNICRIYDLVEGDDADFLVLEHVEGRSLRELIREEVALDEKLRLAEDVALALAAAHREHVVHRDLKPDNVLVTPEGRVKILDFGIARSLAEGAPRTSSSARPGESGVASEPSQDGGETAYRTTFGSMIGTPFYMSPEQAKGEAVAEASDLYSLGIVLQELITGRPAYQDHGFPRNVMQVVEGETVPFATPDADLTALVRELQSLDPEDRPTAEQTAARLRWIREKPLRARRSRNRLAALAGIVVLVLATAVLSRRATEAPLLDPEQSGRVVLFPFVNETGDARLDWVEHGLMAMVADTLDATPGIDVVAPGQLGQVLGSQADAGARPDADEIHRLSGVLGAQLAVLTRVRHDGGRFVLEYSSFNVNGSTGTREVAAADLDTAARRLCARLSRRLAPRAPFTELADRFSADPFVNRLYAMGVQRLETAGGKEARRYFQVSLDVEPDFAWAKLQLAQVGEELGEWDEAHALSEELLKKADDTGEMRLAAASLGLLGKIDFRRGDLDHAADETSRAIELYRGAGDGEGEGWMLNNLAQITRFQGKGEKARAHAEESLAVQKRLGDRIGEARSLQTLATVIAEGGDSEGSRAVFDQALALERELGLRKLEAMTLNSLGVIAGEAGDHDREEQLYLQSLAIHRELGNQASVVLALNNLASVAIERERYEKAESLSREALALAEKLGSADGRAHSAFNLAEVMAHLGRGEEGERWLATAREYYGEVWDVVLVSAKLAALRGDYSRAVSLGERAKKLAGDAWEEQYEADLKDFRAGRRSRG